VVHQRQSLPLLLETGDDLRRVHAGLDELDRYQAFDRLGLLGRPDRPHAARANLLLQHVAAGDDRTDRLAGQRQRGTRGRGTSGICRAGRGFQEVADRRMGNEKSLHPAAQVRVPGAGRVEVGSALLG
jgi:hypothetical protein